MITQLKPLFILLLMSFGVSLNAQSNKTAYHPKFSSINQFAQEAYAEDASVLVLENDYKLKFYKDLFENRLRIVQLDQEPANYDYLSSVPAYNQDAMQPKEQFNPSKFNPLNYKLNYFSKGEKLYYRVYETNYYIVIKKFDPTKIK